MQEAESDRARVSREKLEWKQDKEIWICIEKKAKPMWKGQDTIQET